MTFISPPAGAANRSDFVSIRPEVHWPPESTALITRCPWPSRRAFAIEARAVSTSPVPQLAGQELPLYWVPMS